MKNIIIKTIVISTLTSTFLLGATPNIGTIEKEIKTPNIKKEQPSIPSIKVPEYKTPMSDSGKTIKVLDFKITNNTHIPSSQLEKFYTEFKNKDLTFNQLQDIAAAITKYYREQGYFVARAYIPAQDINKNNGVLEISVIEGTYGEFKLSNNSLVKDSIVQGMLDNAKAKDNVISTNTLERAMLIIGDTPGVIVTQADVMPGKEIGSSDFEITTAPSNRLEGYLITDNVGSIYTGKYRTMLGLSVNSPFGIGDKFSFAGLISNGNDLKNGRLAYEYPLMSNGLRGELSYSRTLYSLTEQYTGTKGDSDTYNLKVDYPVVRSRLENLNTYVDLQIKDTESGGSEIDSKSVNLGLDYNKNYLVFGSNSNSTLNLVFTYGDLDNPNVDTDGNYSKVNLDLSNTIELTKELTFETSLKTQLALNNKNLDGSEDMSIGGSSGVKLYPDGELSAENGYVLTTEFKYNLPTFVNISNSIGIFYDRGRVYMEDKSQDANFQARTLQDAGIGIYSSYKSFFSKLQAAWKIDDEDVTSEDDRNFRFLYQVGMSF